MKYNDLRLQSSFGKKIVSKSDASSVVDKIVLARVVKIHYDTNSVDFVLINGGSVSISSDSEGTMSARLPSLFSGRNGYGNPYGEVYPIRVNNIILIGYISGNSTHPIVLGCYSDDSISAQLSQAPEDVTNSQDPDVYAASNVKYVVYPDLTYDFHDGHGNRALTFSGKSFLLVDSDVEAGDPRDDTEYPKKYTDIKGNSYANGEVLEPIVDTAPDVLFKHSGIVGADGKPDQHAFYVHISKDGTARISQMRYDEDWRTYFEQTPSGKIRIRRQEDSKDFGVGELSSEIGIDENGYATIRSQSSGLVIRPDGIYNLDGTKFTPDVDLSEVWESINEAKAGIKENKAQIDINSNEIATKVSTDELPAAIDDQLKPYADSLKDLQDSYADLQKTIDNMASDGVISSADKKATRTIWLQIQTEYPATIAQAEANSVDHTSLDAAYTTLKSYLAPILAASGDTVVDPTEWDRNFSNYYTASYNVNTAIVAALRKLAQDGYDKAVQAAGDAGDALTQVAQATSEDYLTGADKATLGHVWIQIQNQYPNDVSSADAVNVDHSTLDSAYNDLNTYIQTNKIFADNSTIPIDGESLANKIKAYFTQESVVLKQVADKNIQTLAEYGQDIDHQATAIKETSTKIALSAENIQKQGDSLSVMQGQLNVMANQISGGVSETDVAGIVNDSLSGTGLGQTNQFVLKTATKGQYMNGNDGSSSASTNGIISDYIAVTAGTAYSAKVYGATGTIKLSIMWYDSNKSFISGTGQAGTGDVTNNGTAPTNASYAKVSTDNYNFNTLFIAGDAPSTWAPSYVDAKGNVDSANQLLKSLTDTQANVSASINANGNKKKANVDNIDSMFAGGNLGSTDIGSLNGILTDINSDNSSDNSLATQYGVDISALNNYYGQLKDDINGILGQAEGSSVDINSYRAKLTAYYTSRDTFLKAVKGKIDAQVSSAKQDLSNASDTANEVITNKYANFAATVDGISTKVGEVTTTANNAQSSADTANSAAAKAQSAANSAQETANTAKDNAATAKTAADNAQASANAASTSSAATQASLDAMTDDGNISVIEKQTLAKDYATIKSNKPIDVAQANKYGVDTTAYGNAETAVETMVDPLLSDMSTNSSVDRDKYKSTFSTYYDARTSLLNAIADKAKAAADAAQGAADTAQSTADTAKTNAANAQSSADTANAAVENLQTTTTQKFSEIDQTSEEIKQSVTAVTTTANNANDKINNLQVGGTNLILGTSGPFVMGYGIPNTVWDTTNQVSGISLPVTPTYAEVLPQGTGFPYKYIPGVTYTQSIYISTDAPLTGTPIHISWFTYQYGHITTGVDKLVKVSTNVYRATSTYTWPSSNSSVIGRMADLFNLTQVFDFTKGTFLQFYNPKLEQGNIATDWSPAPEDNASASDLAKTNQTVNTVVTQTAKNWSVLAQGIGGSSAGISVDGNGTVSISGGKLVIGSDLIANDIKGKTITGSTFANTSGTFSIDTDGNIKGATISGSNVELANLDTPDGTKKGFLASDGLLLQEDYKNATHDYDVVHTDVDLGWSGQFVRNDHKDGSYDYAGINALGTPDLYATRWNSNNQMTSTISLDYNGISATILDSSGKYKNSTLTPGQIIQLSNVGHLLWSGAAYMNGTQTVTPSLSLNDCLTGWLLEWQLYVNGAPNNTDIMQTPIFKSVVNAHSGKGFSVDIGIYQDNPVRKYLYPTLTNIKGTGANSTGISHNFVLTSIYAF